MTTTNHTSPSGEDAANGAMPDTGNAEADRIINRLSSSDPDFDDCIDAVAFIRKLVAENKGPEGFATWKDAALNERLRSKGIEMNEKVIDTLRLAIGYIGSSDREDRLEHTRRLRALISSKNGAMGEREAFEAWFKVRGVWPRLTYLEVWEAGRAALTAEKVAAEPVREPYQYAQPGSPEFDGAEAYQAHLEAQFAEQDEPVDFVFPPMPPAVVMHEKVGPLFDRLSMHFYASKCMSISAPQPAQTQVALTDEQFAEIQEAREILENMVRSVELDGNYSTEATCTFLRQALLCLPAAQPVSGGEA